MTLNKWGVPAIVLTAGCAGLTFAVDHLFKAATFEPGERSQAGSRAIAIAHGGFLNHRRAVDVTCVPAGQARVLTKARFAAIHAIGQGNYFRRTGTSADLHALNSCVSG